MDQTQAVAPGKLLIAGEWVDARSGKTFATVNPFDESEIARIAEAGAEDVDAAVAAARRALDSGPWPKMSAAERGKILWRMGELILERLPHLSLLETLDT